MERKEVIAFLKMMTDYFPSYKDRIANKSYFIDEWERWINGYHAELNHEITLDRLTKAGTYYASKNIYFPRPEEMIKSLMVMECREAPVQKNDYIEVDPGELMGCDVMCIFCNKMDLCPFANWED